MPCTPRVSTATARRATAPTTQPRATAAKALQATEANALRATATWALRAWAMICLTVLLAGCGAEIVHIHHNGLSPDGPFAPPAGHLSAQPSAHPSASANGVIRFITGGGTVGTLPPGGVPQGQLPFPAPALPDPGRCRGTGVDFPGDTMLAPDDVWPRGSGAAQAGMAVVFPSGCALGRSTVPIFDCAIGFPWFTASQTSIALASIGVVQFDIDTLTYEQQGVTEYLLHLAGNAGADLIHMATVCDEQQSALDASRQIFRARSSRGVTTSLLRVADDMAIAVVFHGIPEDAKDGLLAFAVTEAGQP